MIKLANFEITILGEVNIPGRYPVYKQGLTIYDAIAMSAGITDYGNLKRVKIIRSHKNKKKIYHIDLTGTDILVSDFYYLRNNDLIYIQPLSFKGLRKSQSQVLLATLTTLAVLFNVFLNITK